MEKQIMGIEGFFGKVIHTYTRKQAIEDGVLVDVSMMAREAGFKVPVAVTHAVWCDYVEPTEELRNIGQSEQGRLWDIMWMLFLKARHCSGDTVRFALSVRFGTEEEDVQRVVLKAVIGPGDEGEPVITIMLPHED